MLQAYALIEGDLVVAKDDGGLYMRADVDALLQSNAATSNEIVAKANARVAELERENDDLTAKAFEAVRRVKELEQRLYDCESALLLRHDRALATYVGKYPHPQKGPTG